MWLDNASDIDFLFYEPYSEIISNIVKDQNNTPTTVGVFGLWGAGKSTLLNLIDKKLKFYQENDNTIVININAWIFEGYEDAKIALMQSLLGELEKNKKTNTFKENIKNLIKRIDFLKIASSAINTGISIAGTTLTGNPGIVAMSVARDAKDIVNFASDVKDSIKSEKVVENIRNFKIEFESLLQESNVNIVVIVDDLDRCSPERIIETLEAIKLFLSVRNTSFIIAADDNVIKYAIKKKYPKMEGMEVELSEEYIEKIIQIPIFIPDLSTKDIENYLLLLVIQSHLKTDEFKLLIEKVYKRSFITRTNRITVEEILEICDESSFDYNDNTQFYNDLKTIDNIRGIVSSTLKGNPRQAKRFLNTFITKKELAKMYYGDDIDSRILAKLLVLQKIDTELFRQLNEWNKEYDTENEKFKEVVFAAESNDFKEEIKRWSTPNVVKWIECEPKNLFEFRLDKYFYLTREHLRKKEVSAYDLSENARTIIDKINHSNEGSIKLIINEMKTLSAEDIKKVFSIILPAFKNGKIDYFVINALFSEFKEYRQDIVAEIISKNEKIPLSGINYLKIMYSVDSKVVGDLLKTLEAKKRISTEITKKIRGEK